MINLNVEPVSLLQDGDRPVCLKKYWVMVGNAVWMYDYIWWCVTDEVYWESREFSLLCIGSRVL